MQEIVLVTGNANKLRELQAIFPDDIKLTAEEVDITEIQSLNSREIVTDKLQKAYEKIGQPVIVEDVSAELAALNGFPGSFIKFAEKLLGEESLYELLKGHDDKRATMRCTMGYFDGHDMIIVDGAVNGTIVKPRGKNGFGFDFCFMLDGETRTNAEMTLEEKNQTSHRHKAVQALLKKLST
jgi:non-canonical purine NTP pyrophosphatase (RdgB/HAM1 family)